MPISEEAYNGGAVHLGNTGPYDVHRGAKVFRVNPGSDESIELLDATTLKIGYQIFIWNDSSVGLQIQSSGGTTISTLAANQIATITLIGNIETIGDWFIKKADANAESTGLMANRDLYILFRSNGGVGSTNNKHYEFSTTTWSNKANASFAKYRATAFRIGDRLIETSGIAAASYRKTNAYSLTDTWAALTDTTIIHVQGFGDAIENNAYLFSGSLSSSYLNVSKYAERNDVWSAVGDIPYYRSKTAAETVLKRIYIIAGVPEDLPNYKYFETDDTYETIADYSTQQRDDLSTFAIQEKVYAIGGRRSGVYYDDVEYYNTLTDTWTVETSISVGTRTGAGCADHEHGYLCGGIISTGEVQTAEEFFNSTWSSIGAMGTTKGGITNSGVAL